MRNSISFNKKFLCTLISLMLLAQFLTGCGDKNSTNDETDIGKLVESNCDIMGVRNNLYSNGYAEMMRRL